MQHATLCYILNDNKVLLAEKKRGPGEGLYNGPGGKIEEGETPHEAARREVEEEIGVTIPRPEKMGEVSFIFGDDPFMHVHIFLTDTFSGTPKETEEMRPAWFDRDDLPYEVMWPDDEYWMPLLFAGKSFTATFIFDDAGDEIREYELERHPRNY